MSPLLNSASEEKGSASVAGPALIADSLRVETTTGAAIVEDVSLTLWPGEIFGVVGETGSGKTTTALATLGYAQAGTRLVGGDITIGGTRLPMGDEKALRSLRGRLVSYVPQNPGTALSPSMRVAQAIAEMERAHGRGRLTSSDQVSGALARVGLPDDPSFARRYPHQISGGQQQRVCTAVALACEPPVVVLDEPTTGLDVVSQARILTELRRLCQEERVAMLYVTHDLAVVAQIADRIAVMYAGRVIEQGPTREVLSAPRHPYTRGLLASIPDHVERSALEPMPGVAVSIGERPRGCAFSPRCPLCVEACLREVPELRQVASARAARCLRSTDVEPSARQPSIAIAREELGREAPVLSVSHLRAEYSSRGEVVVAASDVSFDIHRGRCLALVGESGSGKTTIARAVAGLHPVAGGTVRLDGELLGLAQRRTTEQRRRVQLIFQNPLEALNPRQTVRTAIARPLRRLRDLDRSAAQDELERLLELVRLPSRLAGRYPGELSGGECQRVGIARALASRPDVVICDEITSALDVSVQAAVLTLLAELQAELGLGLLFITHDLGVVATIADEMLVLDGGEVVEQGQTASVLGTPSHGYTQRLLGSAPSVSVVLGGSGIQRAASTAGP